MSLSKKNRRISGGSMLKIADKHFLLSGFWQGKTKINHPFLLLGKPFGGVFPYKKEILWRGESRAGGRTFRRESCHRAVRILPFSLSVGRQTGFRSEMLSGDGEAVQKSLFFTHLAPFSGRNRLLGCLNGLLSHLKALCPLKNGPENASGVRLFDKNNRKPAVVRIWKYVENLYLQAEKRKN